MSKSRTTTKATTNAKLEVGQTIEWSSQSGGFWVKKSGPIVAIVAAEDSLFGRLKTLQGVEVPPSRIRATDFSLSHSSTRRSSR